MCFVDQPPRFFFFSRFVHPVETISFFFSLSLFWFSHSRPHPPLSSVDPGSGPLSDPVSPLLSCCPACWHGGARWTSADQWCCPRREQNMPVQTGLAGRVCRGQVQPGAAFRQRPVPRVSGEHHWRLAGVCLCPSLFPFSKLLIMNLQHKNAHRSWSPSWDLTPNIADMKKC